jgi:hypothetical protein
MPQEEASEQQSAGSPRSERRVADLRARVGKWRATDARTKQPESSARSGQPEAGRGREGIEVVTRTISTFPATSPKGTINTVRNGKIVRVRSYMDRKQALQAAGLPG